MQTISPIRGTQHIRTVSPVKLTTVPTVIHMSPIVHTTQVIHQSPVVVRTVERKMHPNVTYATDQSLENSYVCSKSGALVQQLQEELQRQYEKAKDKEQLHIGMGQHIQGLSRELETWIEKYNCLKRDYDQLILLTNQSANQHEQPGKMIKFHQLEKELNVWQNKYRDLENYIIDLDKNSTQYSQQPFKQSNKAKSVSQFNEKSTNGNNQDNEATYWKSRAKRAESDALMKEQSLLEQLQQLSSELEEWQDRCCKLQSENGGKMNQKNDDSNLNSNQHLKVQGQQEGEIKQLRKKIQDLEKQVKQLEFELQQIQQQNELLKQELANYSNSFLPSGVKGSSSKKYNTEQDDSLTYSTPNVKLMQQELEEWKQRYNNLENEINRLESIQTNRLEIMNKQLEQEKEKSDHLQREIKQSHPNFQREFYAQRQQIAFQENEIEDWKRRYNELENKIKGNEQLFVQKNQQVENLMKELKDLRDKYSLLSEQIKQEKVNWDNSITNDQFTIQQQSQNIENLNNELRTFRQRSDQREKDLLNQQYEYESRIQDMAQEIEKWRISYNLSQTEVEKNYMSLNEASMKEMQNFREQYKRSTQILEQEVSDWKQRYTEIDQKYSLAQKELHQQQDLVNKLSIKIQQAEFSSRKADDQYVTKDSYDQGMQVMENAAKKWQERCSQLEQRQKQNDQIFNRKIQDLQAQIEAWKNKYQEVVGEYEYKISELTEQKRVNNTIQEVSQFNLGQDQSQLENELQIWKNKYDKLLVQYETEKMSQRKNTNDHHQIIYQHQIQALTKELDTWKQKYTSLKNQFEQSLNRYQHLEQTLLDQSRSQVNQTHDNTLIDQLEKELMCQRRMLKDKEQENQENQQNLINQIQTLSKDLQMMVKNYNQIRMDYDQLQNSVNEHAFLTQNNTALVSNENQSSPQHNQPLSSNYGTFKQQLDNQENRFYDRDKVFLHQSFQTDPSRIQLRNSIPQNDKSSDLQQIEYLKWELDTWINSYSELKEQYDQKVKQMSSLEQTHVVEDAQQNLHRQCNKQIQLLKRHTQELQNQLNELNELWEIKYKEMQIELSKKSSNYTTLIEQIEILRRKNTTLQMRVEELLIVENQNFVLQQEVERLKYYSTK